MLPLDHHFVIPQNQMQQTVSVITWNMWQL